MTWIERKPRRAGKITASLLAALLATAALSGCGGGGGGGGSSSSGGGNGGGGGGSTPETTVVTPQAVTVSGLTVGAAATNGVQVSIPAGTNLNGAAPPYSIGIYTGPARNLPQGQTLAGSVYDLRATSPSSQPDGGTFSQPVTVTIQYPNTLTQGQLALTEIWEYDGASSSWQPLSAPTVNTTNGTISAPSTVLTYYALFYPGLPGQPPSP